LFNVWLDMRLVAIFYPETTGATLLSNLALVANELHQPLPAISFGETVHDMLGSSVGGVMIVRHPPANTWVLFTRSAVHVWRLIDDPQGNLKLQRVASS
jgi:hypothetical protein